MLDSYSSVAIERYAAETAALMQESFPRWVEEIRKPVSVLADPGFWFLDSGFCGGPD
jgi:hypothetical protein